MIFVPIGVANKKDFMPMLEADDFTDEKYEGIQLREDDRNGVVLIMKSKSPSPMKWKVVYGYSSVFFKSLEEAVAFCRERGMKLLKGEE